MTSWNFYIKPHYIETSMLCGKTLHVCVKCRAGTIGDLKHGRDGFRRWRPKEVSKSADTTYQWFFILSLLALIHKDCLQTLMPSYLLIGCAWKCNCAHKCCASRFVFKWKRTLAICKYMDKCTHVFVVNVSVTLYVWAFVDIIDYKCTCTYMCKCA